MIVTRLPYCVVESEPDWDEFVLPMTYKYNTQVPKSTGISPFSLAQNSHPSGPKTVQQSSQLLSDAYTERRCRAITTSLERKINELQHHVDTQSRGEQSRYKGNYDGRKAAKPRLAINQ